MRKIIKISRFHITRVKIRYRFVLFITGSAGTKNRVLTGLWCIAFLYKTPENPLISGFATDLATTGRMYILALSMKTYSDVGLKWSIS